MIGYCVVTWWSEWVSNSLCRLFHSFVKSEGDETRRSIVDGGGVNQGEGVNGTVRGQVVEFVCWWWVVRDQVYFTVTSHSAASGCTADPAFLVGNQTTEHAP